MRLLLDEMHAAAVAVALRDWGWDVIAVTERPDLRGASDADLLAWAGDERRIIVTENVGDFALLARSWAGDGRDHAGLIFTNPIRFDRSKLAYPGSLLAALAEWLEAGPEDGPSQVWWL